MPVTRVPEETLELVRQIAREDGESLQSVLVKAVEAYRRVRMLQRLNDAYGQLRADKAAWAEEVAEREQWDAVLADGLEPGPRTRRG